LLKREFWEQVAKWAPVAGQVAGALGRDVRNLEDEQITKQRDLIDDVVGRDVQSEELLKREFWEQVAKWAPVAEQVAGALGRDVKNVE
ncbi:hypothetical protein Bpfe_025319, partial [Biomphalaria pfeifferi]